MTNYFTHHEAAAKKIVADVGKKIAIGVPLGLGKPVGLLNALYQLACDDASIQLTIITGLTLSRPVPQNLLESNFLNPIFDRLLKNYEEPLFEKARELQKLPHNITVIEFFLSPGKFLNNATVQQNYINSSYSTIARDVIQLSINVLAQLVAPSKNNEKIVSLSCNTDLFHDLKDYLITESLRGNKTAIVAEINAHLPFMRGDTAEVTVETFTDIIDTKHYPALFPLPREALSAQDHLIGLYTSCLIKDDGCLQIGIGNLSIALASALILRHKENNNYQDLLSTLEVKKKFGRIISTIGEIHVFNEGLYASTEMFSDEYMALYQANILKKKVYDDIELQKLLHSKKINKNTIPHNKIKSGKIMHAGFFLGSADFYKQLHILSEDELSQFEMVSIARTNTLLWSPELLKLQRKNARFVNTSLMVNLLGGIISDGLQDYRELSGVGGQYDFVSMAHQLEGAYSIMNCRSTRETKRGTVSNIVWDYPNMTLPRYLRDIIVTEYGIADCRSKTDADVIKAILTITDSRFQTALLKKAKKTGKLSSDYEIPDCYKNNYPEKIETIIREMQALDYCMPYPFGSDLTKEEEILARALLYLKNCSTFQLIRLTLMSLCFFKSDRVFNPYLSRMNLKNPRSIKEFIYKKIVKYVMTLMSGEILN